MKRKKSRGKNLALGVQAVCVLFAELGGLSVATPSYAAQQCERSFATVVATQGEVRYRATSQAAWQPATLEQALCVDTELQVAPGSRAALRLSNGSAIPLDQNTHIVVRGLAADGVTVQVEVVSGSINVASSTASPIQIVTPHGQVKTDGGDFAVRVTPQESALSVFDGDVAVSNPEGSMLLHSDETVFFAQLSAPKRDITLKPQELVQWVVQYPVLISAADTQPAAWAEAARAYEQGRSLDALISLDQVPDTARSAEYYIYRANLLLQAGQVDEARANVESALKLTPGLPQAWALLAILDLGKNNIAQALQHAEKALQLGPQSATAHLAHSYALQAHRRTDEALHSARRVVELAPDSALGYTRLAELELARGNGRGALKAAQRAEQIDPKFADAKVMLGFVYLSQLKLKAAREAFESAVQLNSSDSRARLGLGLTRIRQGKLRAGREDLELAASLDPENPLLRTYLGRAYAEEGRNAEAGTQYARAKRGDPQDPTPYFFNAIRLANQNQPVSADQEMRQALARNDNRAVYRGQSLLQEDRELRRANAIALNLSLGLDDVARFEAGAAVSANPQVAVLHRALGDALASLPRTASARQSEYLQSTLRAPLGTPPPPLPLTENLISDGGAVVPQHGFFQAVEPGQSGFNEYSAIFNRSAWQAQIDTTLGAKDTYGHQVNVSGAHGEVGWSLTQLKFKTDGFGENDRLDNTAWRGIIQADLPTNTRLHLERRIFDSNRIDVQSPAQPLFFFPIATEQHQTTSRYGLRQRIGEAQELLLLQTRDRARYDLNFLPTAFNDSGDFEGVFLPFRIQTDRRLRNSESQYHFHTTKLDLFIGQIRVRSDSVRVDDGVSVGTIISRQTARSDYAYFSLRPWQALSIELGVSRDRQQENTGLDQRLTSPKFGVRWEILPGGTLRLASIRGVSRFAPSLSGATLEPAQIAGFNQNYTDFFARRTERRSIAWDQKLNQGVTLGAEATRREIGRPTNSATPTYTFNYEREFRAYANWAIPPALMPEFLPSWEGALNARFDRNKFLRPQLFDPEGFSDYTARHLRLGANFSHASGIGIDIGATNVDYHGTYQELFDAELNENTLPFSNRVWILDAALSYQLPGKRGKVTLGVLNFSNQRLPQYLEIDPLTPRFAPERFAYAKFLFNF